MVHFVKILVMTVVAMIISILNDDKIFEYFGLERDEISWNSILIGFLMGIVTVLGEIIAFLVIWVYGREIWYCYLIPIAICIFKKFVDVCLFMKRKYFLIALPILVIAFAFCVALPIRDIAIPYNPKSNTETIVVTERRSPLLSKKEIKVKLNATSISSPTYSDGKYVYEINKYDESGYGIVVDDSSSVKFIPCEYENTISGIVRKHYKSKEIESLGIEMNGEVPYARFAIIKRPKMFGEPKVDFYVLLNMQTGEITKS